MTIARVQTISELQDAIKSPDGVSVVYFCLNKAFDNDLVHAALDRLHVKNLKNIKLYEIQVERNSHDVINTFKLKDFPVVKFYKGGELIDQVVGMDPIKVVEKCIHFNQPSGMVAAENNNSIDSQSHEDLLTSRLKTLINSHPWMLFMKGSPDNVQCRFSRQIVAILNEKGLKYGHFDILSDNSVREGLKQFSNWPTYPQLYYRGELLGGVDIVVEMNKSGELDNLINIQSNGSKS